MELYVIYTENAFDQVLIFTSKADAIEWAEKATNWSVAEIKNNIKKAHKTDNYYTVANTDRWDLYT